MTESLDFTIKFPLLIEYATEVFIENFYTIIKSSIILSNFFLFSGD
jgi:hypothetical protein